MLSNLKQELQDLADPEKAKRSQRFFKTGLGQYGEGDVFLGITMPEQRQVAKNYLHLSIKEVENLLHSNFHEHRMTALVIWTYQYEKADQQTQQLIYQTYLKNTKWINNWDLVDVTTPRIVGQHIFNRDRKILYQLAKSTDLWEKRISILATFWFIKNDQFDDTLKIAKILLNDSHDLIHKAVGWALREVGKRNQAVEEKFLKQHYKTMPRTVLRYAIERFPEPLRKQYLHSQI
tara:strand:- start:201 stop:902 length:702 start_codon:yes stop_codon:yes gene_type:complete